MLKVERTGQFEKSLNKLYEDNPEIRQLVKVRIRTFQFNPNDSRLKNHALRSRMRGKFAFSIASDVRIVYETIGKNTVRFLTIGSHKHVYRL